MPQKQRAAWKRLLVEEDEEEEEEEEEQQQQEEDLWRRRRHKECSEAMPKGRTPLATAATQLLRPALRHFLNASSSDILGAPAAGQLFPFCVGTETVSFLCCNCNRARKSVATEPASLLALLQHTCKVLAPEQQALILSGLAGSVATHLQRFCKVLAPGQQALILSSC